MANFWKNHSPNVISRQIIHWMHTLTATNKNNLRFRVKIASEREAWKAATCSGSSVLQSHVAPRYSTRWRSGFQSSTSQAWRDGEDDFDFKGWTAEAQRRRDGEDFEAGLGAPVSGWRWGTEYFLVEGGEGLAVEGFLVFRFVRRGIQAWLGLVGS